MMQSKPHLFFYLSHIHTDILPVDTPARTFLYSLFWSKLQVVCNVLEVDIKFYQTSLLKKHLSLMHFKSKF